jgi:ribosomal protein S18 acetylase RimI-like enzyme
VADLTITRAGAEALDRLEPLWLVLHHHHQDVGGRTLAPYVDDEFSWAARRAMYAGFLEPGGDSFVLLAEDGDELVAYAMVAVSALEDTWVHDTWRAGSRIAEIETVCVTPQARGRGIGSALLDRIDDELAEAGIDDVVIGAVVPNVDAIRLYQRRGFRPTWVYLSRFAGR